MTNVEFVSRALVPVVTLTVGGRDVDIIADNINGVFNGSLLNASFSVRRKARAFPWRQAVHKAAGPINPRQGMFDSFAVELLAVAFLVAGLVQERQNAALAHHTCGTAHRVVRLPRSAHQPVVWFVCPACFAPFRAHRDGLSPDELFLELLHPTRRTTGRAPSSSRRPSRPST